MANPEHLAILKQGVQAWNKRQETQPFRADLREANLSGANFVEANLVEANLSGADLRRANLSGADLIGADLRRANLSGAYLSRAHLIGANLIEADLSGANLIGANLSGAHLEKADFNAASLGWTTFARVDLSTVKGLETVSHKGPSSIGIDTVYRSKGNIRVPPHECRRRGFSDNGRASGRPIPGRQSAGETPCRNGL